MFNAVLRSLGRSRTENVDGQKEKLNTIKKNAIEILIEMYKINLPPVQNFNTGKISRWLWPCSFSLEKTFSWTFLLYVVTNRK